MVFVDVIFNIEEYNFKVFLMCINNVFGVFLFGILIISDE